MATVSTPVAWKELEGPLQIEDFHLGNVPARLTELGDLWKPLLARGKRFQLEKVLDAA
jgi:bifunctional non-homologous end joining protein LigD